MRGIEVTLEIEGRAVRPLSSPIGLYELINNHARLERGVFAVDVERDVCHEFAEYERWEAAHCSTLYCQMRFRNLSKSSRFAIKLGSSR